MTALGTAPFGTSRFGGAGEIVIRGAIALTRRDVLVDFDKVPKALDPVGFDSATNPKNWVIVGVDPTLGGAPTEEPVPTYTLRVVGVDYDKDFPTQVLVGTDLIMEKGVRYDLTAQPSIRGAECEALVDDVTWQVLARQAKRESPISRYYTDRYLDIRTDSDGAVVTATGDIDTVGGIDGLKIRIYRRITTALGGFVMLAGYGTAVKLKTLLRPGDAQALANEIQAQVTAEPDVARGDAVVRLVVVDGAQILQVDVRVVRREGQDQTYLYEFPQAGVR